jgi:hypothetical protein
MDLWNNENPVSKYDIDVPAWIDQDISPYDVAAIVQGGCASGAYMPAVTYYDAKETMNAHGDDIMQYIEDQLGELPEPPKDVGWDQMACFFVSYAVELWAFGVESELENIEEEEEGEWT